MDFCQCVFHFSFLTCCTQDFDSSSSAHLKGQSCGTLDLSSSSHLKGQADLSSSSHLTGQADLSSSSHSKGLDRPQFFIPSSHLTDLSSSSHLKGQTDLSSSSHLKGQTNLSSSSHLKGQTDLSSSSKGQTSVLHPIQTARHCVLQHMGLQFFISSEGPDTESRGTRDLSSLSHLKGQTVTPVAHGTSVLYLI